jgi:hypothetical protein
LCAPPIPAVPLHISMRSVRRPRSRA